MTQAQTEDRTDPVAHAADLAARYGHLHGAELLRPLLTGDLKGRIALVSSFGTESAVLLHMVAEIDPGVPVIFIDTGKLFGETLRYRDRLVALLGLTDLRSPGPDPAEEAREDADGGLWRRDAGACCALRKVRPLGRALAPFDAWITGRKRFQAATRAVLPAVEAADGRIKVNPLAGWSRQDLTAYLDRHGLPRHPLEADGFLSIGCMPCTDRVAPGEDIRAGRWRGQGKTECGIHRPAPAG
ncbi:phosphoadenylyl-sulfate reductase [Rhodospirillum centenum]|uniref:Adenosine 5'-phosphosulfate reductase n=1 Tax=Rhodospirillum centenum (strain ATCC 51521 / SW) TaxID=414684 RepID=B6IP66_RHOCS|nr:phosphoadenylyl-sulfate reductase [Rhodospirillum centenum]ACI99568.1 phosphoadenosine phosphosulfate reductase [Rhodospirillum centenum SW]